jgi:3-methylcrotonyl-CoA carboxylase alpha subunit
MFNKILIANRGEIACRIIRTCHRFQIKTVAVYSDADANAQHVLQADEAYYIGGSRPAESYLKADVILAIAKKSGAEAVHPGYGFLSENADFARACEAANIAFIGPTPKAIAAMGSKSAAKALMQAAGVPVVPGYHGDNQEPAYLLMQSAIVGYPQLIKAVAGGGGKGMRLVSNQGEFMAQLDAAKRESKNAFNNDDVLIERYIQNPHHIEFQVFGDTHGNYVHLFERECSIQRRHQKILEETPSPFLDEVDDLMRDTMGGAAIAAARAINYRGAGTIEFIAGENREFFFMEMNTRLQVEHPITEMITGEDLVEWQLRVAANEPLPLIQAEVITGGHAIEVRICAENPDNDFLPETGVIQHFAHPIIEDGDDVRLDTGVVSGDTISVYYDPMVAKLITWGGDRREAIRRMQNALSETAVIGVKTNIGFLQNLLQHPAFIVGKTDTGFINQHKDSLLATSPLHIEMLAAACAKILHDESALNTDTSPWAATNGWRLNSSATRQFEFKSANSDIVTCSVTSTAGVQTFQHAQTSLPFEYVSRNKTAFDITLGQQKTLTRIVRASDDVEIITATSRLALSQFNPYLAKLDNTANEGRLTAMMPGRVVKLMVAANDDVKKGQPLIIMEAMKMEHTIVSPRDGVIERVAFQVGEMVPADAVLFAFREG